MGTVLSLASATSSDFLEEKPSTSTCARRAAEDRPVGMFKSDLIYLN